MAGDILTPSRLHELLVYDPQTGAFTWIERKASDFTPTKRRSAEFIASNWNSRFAWKPAFPVKSCGYCRSPILGRSYLGHRVAWAMTHGEWPLGQIDHENHDKSDNRISNLRLTDNSGNSRNHPLHSTNTSGRVGVGFMKHTKKWRAYIRVGDETIHLGSFCKKKDAIAARAAAEKEHNFHQNHGKAKS